MSNNNTGEAVPPVPDLPPATDDRSPGLRALQIAMIVLVTVMITLRFTSRLVSKNAQGHVGHYRSLWWDDWTALAATIFMLAQLVMVLWLLDLGVGKHFYTMAPENIPKFFNIMFIGYFIYDLHLVLAKASALFFLTRIFPSKASPKWFTISVYVTHGLNVAWFVGIVLGTFFQCDPVKKNWMPMLPEGECADPKQLFLGSAIPSVVVDLAILLVPMPMLWSLKMSRAKKMAIIGIFALGYCAVVVSLGRLVTVILIGGDLALDITWESAPTFYWFTVETPVILVSTCLPAMLSLGRLLGISYFKPLATKLSSVWSTRGSRGGTLMSKTGDFTQQNESRLNKSKTGVETNVTNKRSSEESQSRIYLPQNGPQYSTEVSGWEMQDQAERGAQRGQQGSGIYVQQEVEVRTQRW